MSNHATEDLENWSGKVVAGQWQLTGRLGIGGMSTVFIAKDSAGQVVALKIMHIEYAGEPKFVKRFLDEVEVMKSLVHEGAVKVIDAGTTEAGVPYLAMELLEGETLADRADRKGDGRLPAKEVLWAADRVLGVLVSAHKRGIVHRDIKPENIFLTYDRKVKLLDFGIARLQREYQPDSDRTRIGMAMGTPGFMPPEQARGAWDKIGVEADLWAVGATMFALITGHLVHEESRPMDQILAAATKPAPKVSTFAPWLPVEISELIDLSLCFDPAKRWPTAKTMRSALRLAYAQGLKHPIIEEDQEIPEPQLFFDEPSAPPQSMVMSPSLHLIKMVSGITNQPAPSELVQSTDENALSMAEKQVEDTSPTPTSSLPMTKPSRSQ